MHYIDPRLISCISIFQQTLAILERSLCLVMIFGVVVKVKAFKIEIYSVNSERV